MGAGSGNGIDESALKHLNNRMDKMQSDLDALRNELLKWIKEF
jgi:hypothetical protein